MTSPSFRRSFIERMLAENGNLNCHYCNIECRPGYRNIYKDSATVDHKIPKCKGGTNARENLVLACNECNNLKGNRSYEDFIANPNKPNKERVPRRRNARFVYSTETHPARHFQPSFKVVKFGKGTLAHAIASGVMEPHGVYKRHKIDMGEPRNRVIPQNTYAETMWILTGKRGVRKADLLDKR